MADRTKAKDKDTKAEIQPSLKPEDENTQMINLRPLPQNRPIADNVTENMDELMGYLD